MAEETIVLPEPDMRRLLALVEGAYRRSPRDREALEHLASHLERADVVPAQELPPDAVSMHSTVRLSDVDTGEEAVYTVVYPLSADVAARRISVIAPIGAALIGRREGEEIRARTPRGTRRLRIVEVAYQPESVARATLRRPPPDEPWPRAARRA